MNILICGVGALGSNILRASIPDLSDDHKITIIDMDKVEERNVIPGTQWYSPDQIGMSKVEALQYNVYHWFEREIEIINKKFEHKFIGATLPFDLIIDCFDNQEARMLTQIHTSKNSELLHVGFSDQFTFEIEWTENYQVPTDITSGFDICETQGASSFISMVSSLASSTILRYINHNEKLRFIGGRQNITQIR